MYILSFDVASKSLAVSLLLYDDDYKNKIDAITNEIEKLYIDIKNINGNTSSENIYKTLNTVKNKLIEYNNIISNGIKPIFLDVVDLIPDKKIKDTTVINRANRLKSYLNYIDKLVYEEIDNKCINKKIHKYIPIKVLLEYQMGPNDKSRNVCSQILYNYSKNDDCGFKSYNFDINKTIHSDKSGDFDKNHNLNLSHSVEIVGPSLKNKINLDKKKDHQFFLNKYTNKYDANKKHSSHNFLLWINQKSSECMIEKIPKKNIDDISDSVTMGLSWIKYNFHNI